MVEKLRTESWVRPNIMLKVVLGLLFSVLMFFGARAEVIYSQGSGSWVDPSTWSGTISEGDTIIIQAGDIITISGGNIYNSNPLNLQITVEGGMFFEGSRLFLGEESTITFKPGGFLEGNNTDNKEKLKIGDTFVWTEKDGRVEGPYQFTSRGGSVVLPVIAVTALKALPLEEGGTHLSWDNEVREGTSSNLVIQGSHTGRDFDDLVYLESNDFSGRQTVELLDVPYTYFQIGIIDEDGFRVFSKVISADTDEIADVEVFPNPMTKREFYLTGEGVKEVFIQNHTGMVVHTFSKTFSDDFNELDLPSWLPNGMYLLRVITSEKNYALQIDVKR